MNIKVPENPQRCITNILVIKTIVGKNMPECSAFEKKYGLTVR